MDYLGVRVAALRLGVSYPTVKQWIYSGKIRTVKTVGGHHRIAQSEIDRLLFRQGGPQRELVFRNSSAEETSWWAGLSGSRRSACSQKFLST